MMRKNKDILLATNVENMAQPILIYLNGEILEAAIIGLIITV
jgi:hypothetical protein